MPAIPTAIGLVVLSLAGAGAISFDEPASRTVVLSSAQGDTELDGTELDGTDAPGFTEARRQLALSRDTERQALQDAADKQVEAETEQQAQERNAALKKLGQAAEKHAALITKNQWHLPTSGYRLTARFGMSGSMWSSNHTGLDFATASGTPIVAVANGRITETGYDGSYGNKTVQTLDDGTELWYCHQTTIGVKVGDTVTGGQQIGTVGSTGNSTGPHLHLEVRPGGGDPVDPFSALVVHGIRP